MSGNFNRSLTSLALTILFVVALLAIAPHRSFANGDCVDCDVTSNSTPKSSGTDFLLCFEQNIDPTQTFGDSSYIEIYMASLGDVDTVTITSRRYPNFKKVFVLQPNGSQTYRITNDPALWDLWITSHGDTDNRVVRVQSSAPIACYGMNYKVFSADAFLALPHQSSGTDYRILSYQNSTNPVIDTSTWLPSQFAVAAFEDNTIVTLTPSAPTLGGHAAGVPFQVTLQSGQCVQLQTDQRIPGLDLTGSMVSANHPVAVYGSHARTEIPAGFINTQGNTSRDMLLEAMLPTSVWGHAFVLNAVDVLDDGSKNPGGDLMRVLALDDNTTVTVNGVNWVTLNRNQFADSLIHKPVLVQGTNPLQVGEYFHTSFTGGGNGDPSLALVPPVDQSYNNFTFFASTDPAFAVQHLAIATEARSKGTITLNGSPIPAAAFTTVPGTYNGNSYAFVDWSGLKPGANVITSTSTPDQGFTILSYGMGPVISYGYTAGALLVPKRALFIEYPPEAKNGHHGNTIDFRNTCYAPVYLDSAVFVTNSTLPTGIHFREDVASDIGRLDIGGTAQIHLVTDRALSDPIRGTVKIYSHTAAQFNLEPAERDFTFYPDAAAGVTPGAPTVLGVTASPNPFSLYTTISFSMPASGDLDIVLYDELGREVRHIANSQFAMGPYSIRIERFGLPRGFYTCILSSEKLNIKERVAIVAGE